MQTTSAIDAVLKENYVGGVIDQINRKVTLLNLFTKQDATKQQWTGRVAIIPLHKGRNVGVKAVAENGQLPAAGAQQFAKLQVAMTQFYGRIQLSANVIKVTQSDKGAFVRAMDVEQKQIVDDVSRQRNRYLAGAGTGILCKLDSLSNANLTYTVKDPGAVVGTTNPIRYLQEGMLIAVHNGTSSTVRGTATIQSIDSDVAFTIDVAVAGAAQNDIITLGASNGGVTEGSYLLEPEGVLSLADSTTYKSTIHGLNRSLAANRFFRSTVLSSVGTLTPDILYRGVNNAEEVGGGKIDKFLCHYSVQREYLKITEGDRRYTKPDGSAINADPGNPAGVSKGEARFSGLNFTVDKDFAYGTLVAVDPEHLAWMPLVEGEWADEDGAILRRATNQDNFEGRFRVWENFYAGQGNALVRFDGINATVTAQITSL